MSRQQTKALQYIQQLNDARCEGSWEAVTELVRKVRKHAPERSCLALTAESECVVARTPKTNRPPTESSANSLSRLIPPLLEAIEKEEVYVEDEFQARVCLGWIHWILDEPALAIARLPKDIDHDFAELDGTGKQSAGWTRVCTVKGAYLKGVSNLNLGANSEALLAFDTGLPILSLEGSNLGHELCVWTELLLSNACLLYSKMLASKRNRIFETETISAFRLWAKFWDIQSGLDSVPGGSGIQSSIPRRHVWRKYYSTLSDLLQKGEPYPTSSFIPAYVDDFAKVRQSAELEKVQTIYEGLLLAEVPFPKAEEESEEVEGWVETVARNWSVLCNSWQENELPKGREGTSRHVLDILYRAATKTFHSTRILRYLFIVHLAVADFDLAFKAFDTYLDIVKKGKAREEKTGKTEHALDDDETVLMTATECIQALCRYGSRYGAEKARDVGRYVEDWLNKPIRDDIENPGMNGNGHDIGQESNDRRSTAVSMHVISKAWLSVGLSHAQWARHTYETAARSEIQLQAIQSFRRALSPELKNDNDVEALFALGILLSERRQIDTAIEVVKSALLPSSSSNDSTSRDLGPYRGEFAKERSLIPLWHLLALLLSARQEFMTAARSCEGAFEQFRDPTNLFGHSDSAYRSDHLNEKSKASLGAVDSMEDIEKETILEVKITQLALVEVLEGPEVAVNASDELLSLYARLFGDPVKSLSSTPSKTAYETPPKSSAGTIRTLGGSLFGRSTKPNRHHSKTTAISEKSEGAMHSARPQTNATQAPAIQITNDAGGPSRQRVQTFTRERSTHRHEKLQKPRNRSSSTSRAAHSKNNTGISSAEHSLPSSAYFTPPDSAEQGKQWTDGESSMVGVAITSEDPHLDSNSKPSKLAAQLPLKSSDYEHQGDHFPQIFIRNPAPRFPKGQERRRRLGTLVRLWLLVAGFYRRATMLDDATGALEEAKKLVEALEVDVSKDQSGEVSVQNSGWGGGKSVEELWGDVWAERGQLSLAKGLPHIAQADYEAGLTSFADHPLATIGLSNILLDTYAEALLAPSAPKPSPFTHSSFLDPSVPTSNPSVDSDHDHGSRKPSTSPQLNNSPLGLPIIKPVSVPAKVNRTAGILSSTASSTALLDRLAARDRAYGLLSALTKSGQGWNNSEAWFALARAYEEGGQINKSRECLWWCIELEEARGIRGWDCVAAGGYVL